MIEYTVLPQLRLYGSKYSVTMAQRHYETSMHHTKVQSSDTTV